MTPSRTQFVIAALAVLALGGALSACGSAGGISGRPKNAAGGDPSAPVASSPSPSPPGRSSPPPSAPSHPSSPGTSSPSPPVAAPPDITVVRLGSAFSPSSLRVSVGQQFLITVSKTVQARGLEPAAGCASGSARPAAGGLLSVRCASGGYLYTAEHPGTATISATVGPRCSPGEMCPQWMSEPRLQLTIT